MSHTAWRDWPAEARERPASAARGMPLRHTEVNKMESVDTNASRGCDSGVELTPTLFTDLDPSNSTNQQLEYVPKTLSKDIRSTCSKKKKLVTRKQLITAARKINVLSLYQENIFWASGLISLGKDIFTSVNQQMKCVKENNLKIYHHTSDSAI